MSNYITEPKCRSGILGLVELSINDSPIGEKLIHNHIQDKFRVWNILKWFIEPISVL